MFSMVLTNEPRNLVSHDVDSLLLVNQEFFLPLEAFGRVALCLVVVLSRI